VFVQVLGVAIDYSHVHYWWTVTQLQPEKAYLFDPAISAIPIHLVNLLGWRHVDLWLVWVLREYGPGIFLLSAMVPAVALATGLVLVRGAVTRRSEWPRSSALMASGVQASPPYSFPLPATEPAGSSSGSA
jgi:hypothetical protein